MSFGVFKYFYPFFPHLIYLNISSFCQLSCIEGATGEIPVYFPWLIGVQGVEPLILGLESGSRGSLPLAGKVSIDEGQSFRESCH